MGRTILSGKRNKNTIPVNLGRILIFCEGATEKYYLEYFADIIRKNKFNDIKVEIESANGNASRVFHFAEAFLEDENNNRKYHNYKKYLVFDCDAPPNIQKIILQMLSSNDKLELLISNYLFEVWLLMHFEDVETKMTKKEIYNRLSDHLKETYGKASQGIIREIIQNGSVEDAINNAEKLVNKYKVSGKDIKSNIGEMNPFSNMHFLIEQIMSVIS
ncbi:RloB family protein [Clostridium oryzae]|uniref:RloB family protein n=1 Tax=Clostridium oryzae TaxID=1450648 RepID=UPI001472C38B|nr:RloB family protein [Clostridium oryzae]